MKLSLSLTLSLAALAVRPVWTAAAPQAARTTPAAPPAAAARPTAAAAPSGPPAAPAALTGAADTPAPSAVQGQDPDSISSALNTLETGYNIFNLLAAPSMYSPAVTYAADSAGQAVVVPNPAPAAKPQSAAKTAPAKKASKGTRTGKKTAAGKVSPPAGAAASPAAGP